MRNPRPWAIICPDCLAEFRAEPYEINRPFTAPATVKCPKCGIYVELSPHKVELILKGLNK